MRELPHLFATDTLTRHDAAVLATAVKAMADPARIEILSILAAEPGMAVRDIVAAVGRLAQPTISHHLHLLRDAGLVVARADGHFIHYSIDERNLNALADAIRPAGTR